jgi:hypothetical protein
MHSKQGGEAYCALAIERRLWSGFRSFPRRPAKARHPPIVWKNPQNDRSRKSRFHAPNLICAGNRHYKAHGRATHGKIARAAEPLPSFPSSSSIAV